MGYKQEKFWTDSVVTFIVIFIVSWGLLFFLTSCVPTGFVTTKKCVGPNTCVTPAHMNMIPAGDGVFIPENVPEITYYCVCQ